MTQNTAYKWQEMKNRRRVVGDAKIELISPSLLTDQSNQFSQPVSRQNHPPVGNPARTNNIAHGKHGNRCNHRAIQISTPRNPNPRTVTVSDLRRNLVALFSPRLKVSARKFGKLTPLKLLAVSFNPATK
jgi:hypothetical protein